MLNVINTRVQRQFRRRSFLLFYSSVGIIAVVVALLCSQSDGKDHPSDSNTSYSGSPFDAIQRSPSHPSLLRRTPTTPRGIPAIPVQPGTITNDPNQGSFSAQQAIAYVNTFGILRSVSRTKPRVTSVQFIQQKQVNILLHGDGMSIPDDTLLCYVELEGEISFPGYNGVVTFQRGFVVFDAKTGNELMNGGLK